jgi:hypothetical protein
MRIGVRWGHPTGGMAIRFGTPKLKRMSNLACQSRLFPPAQIWRLLSERYYGNHLILVRAREQMMFLRPFCAFRLDLSVHSAIADLP